MHVFWIVVGPLAPSLNVEHRLKIAASAARGLNYLHSERREVVVHRDIKSNNILLDENMEVVGVKSSDDIIFTCRAFGFFFLVVRETDIRCVTS